MGFSSFPITQAFPKTIPPCLPGSPEQLIFLLYILGDQAQPSERRSRFFSDPLTQSQVGIFPRPNGASSTHFMRHILPHSFFVVLTHRIPSFLITSHQIVDEDSHSQQKLVGGPSNGLKCKGCSKGRVPSLQSSRASWCNSRC